MPKAETYMAGASVSTQHGVNRTYRRSQHWVGSPGRFGNLKVHSGLGRVSIQLARRTLNPRRSKGGFSDSLLAAASRVLYQSTAHMQVDARDVFCSIGPRFDPHGDKRRQRVFCEWWRNEELRVEKSSFFFNYLERIDSIHIFEMQGIPAFTYRNPFVQPLRG